MRVLLGLVAVALLAAVGTVLLLPGDGTMLGTPPALEAVAEQAADSGPLAGELEGDLAQAQRGPVTDAHSKEHVPGPILCRIVVEALDARNDRPWSQGLAVYAYHPESGSRVDLEETAEGWVFEPRLEGWWNLCAVGWDGVTDPESPEYRPKTFTRSSLRRPDCEAEREGYIEAGTEDTKVILRLYPDVAACILVRDEMGRGLWSDEVAPLWRSLRDHMEVRVRSQQTDGEWRWVWLNQPQGESMHDPASGERVTRPEDLMGTLRDFRLAPQYLALFLGGEQLGEVPYTPGQDEVQFMVNTAAVESGLGGFRGKVVDAVTGDDLTAKASWVLSVVDARETFATGGGAEYDSLPAGIGEYTLQFRVEGYAEASRQFSVSPGSVHDLRTVAMRPVEVVEVSVQDKNGEPVRIGLKLGYPGPNGEVVFDQSHYSDGDGLIRIEDLAADRYVLRTVTERKLPDGRTVLAPVTWFQVREGQSTKVQIFVEEAVHVPVENPGGVDGRISFHSQGVEVYSTRLSEAEQHIWLLKGQYDWSTSLWDRGRDEGVLGVTPDDPWIKSGTLTVTNSARLRLPGPDSR